ncbi:MAG: hypothetical protein RLZZ444_4275, partial [Pseudomonadota bacterium]
MRMFEQAILETFMGSGLRIAHDTGKHTHDGVEKDHR